MPQRAGLMVDIQLSYQGGGVEHHYKSYDPTTPDQTATQDYTGLSVAQVLALNNTRPTAPGTPWTVVGSGFPYSRVLFIGNSITNNGGDKGLAASSSATDYYHILRSRMLAVKPTAQVIQLKDITGTPATGGIPLDISDGPRWEASYWDLFSNPVYAGGLARFKAVQNWKPDMLIVSLSENITDLSHNYPAALKALIDYITAQNPSCRVVLRSSVWGQTSVSAATQSVATERGYTYIDMTGVANTQADPGTGHPNDSGMLGIANAYWAGIYSGATIPTDPLPGDSFDYTPLPESSRSDAYPVFETEDIRAVIALLQQFPGTTAAGLSGEPWKMYDKHDPAYNNSTHTGVSTVKYTGVAKAPGEAGTITTGAGLGISIYRNPRPFYFYGPTDGNISGPHLPEGPGLGINSLIGDDGGNTGQLLNYGRVGNRYYTKMKTVLYSNYAMYDPACIYEQWREFVGKVMSAHVKITINNPGNLPLPDGSGYFPTQSIVTSFLQEFPGVYFNASDGTKADGDINGNGRTRVTFYQGNAPYTNGSLTQFNIYGAGDRRDTQHVTEPWIAVVDGNDRGYGIIMKFPESTINIFGSGDHHKDRSSNNDICVYLGQNYNIMFDDQIVYYSSYKLVWGTLSEIRAEATKTENRLPATPSYKWNKASRENWTYESYGDVPEGGQGKRTWDDGVNAIASVGYWNLHFGRSVYSTISSPPVAWVAASCPKIYIKIAYTGNRTQWLMTWTRNGQLPNRDPSTSEETTRWPNGQPNGNQRVYFNVIGDGVARVYEIDLTSRTEWRDIITGVVIRPNTDSDNSIQTGAHLFWIHTSAAGPA